MLLHSGGAEGKSAILTGRAISLCRDLDATTDVISWYQDMVQRGIIRTPGEDFFFSGPFANQQVQMYISSGNEGEFINMKIPESNKFEWSCAPIPQFEDGTKADYAEGFLLSHAG